VLFARSDWLTRRWLASTIHLRATGVREFQLFRPLFLHKIKFWSANYLACVVSTKTIIIHLSVGESDVHHYSPPLWWIIVNYTMPYKCGKCTREFLGKFLFPFQSSFPRFWGVFNKTIIPLALVGYEMITANSALRASLVIYHLISNARSWNYCSLSNRTKTFRTCNFNSFYLKVLILLFIGKMYIITIIIWICLVWVCVLNCEWFQQKFGLITQSGHHQ